MAHPEVVVRRSRWWPGQRCIAIKKIRDLASFPVWFSVYKLFFRSFFLSLSQYLTCEAMYIHPKTEFVRFIYF